MTLRVVVITGAPGVGKTESARRLLRCYDVPSATVDTDRVADVWPWAESSRLYQLIGNNLGPVIRGHREYGARVVVISGVILPNRVYPYLREALAGEKHELFLYGLRAREDTLHARISRFVGVQEAGMRAGMARLDEEVPGLPGVREIHTDDLDADQVADELCRLEGLAGAPVTPWRMRTRTRGAA